MGRDQPVPKVAYRIEIDSPLEFTAVNYKQLQQIPSKLKKFFPDPVWKGDGTTWETFIRTCPPNSAVRKVITSMTDKVVHLADAIHVAYNDTRRTTPKRPTAHSGKIAETIEDGEAVEVKMNVKPPSRRKRTTSPPVQLSLQASRQIQPRDAVGASDDPSSPEDIFESQSSTLRPGQNGIPTRDVFLDTLDFEFNDNMTSLSHDQLCNDPRAHDTQGQFCSDFRSLDTLYPVFSPSTMPGFADVVIPSRKPFLAYK